MPFKSNPHSRLIKKISEQCGCSIETVRGWEKEGAPIGNARKLKEWLAGRKSGNDELEPADLKAAKLAKIKAETRRIVFALEVSQGDYTPNAEVTRILVSLGAQTRAEMMSLISEAPGWAGLTPAQLQDKAKSFVLSALGRLTENRITNQTT